jgi:uncharacterized protein (DUF4415 family)
MGRSPVHADSTLHAARFTTDELSTTDEHSPASGRNQLRLSLCGLPAGHVGFAHASFSPGETRKAISTLRSVAVRFIQAMTYEVTARLSGENLQLLPVCRTDKTRGAHTKARRSPRRTLWKWFRPFVARCILRPMKKSTARESRTDWRKLATGSDAQIDTSDIPALNEDFFREAQLRTPKGKQLVSLRLDSDILDWFKRQGRGYQTRINAVLRAYVRSHKR